MTDRSGADLHIQAEQIMKHIIEAHQSTGEIKQAIDREKATLEVEIETANEGIRDSKLNFENTTRQLRQHITILHHDTQRDTDALRKACCAQLGHQFPKKTAGT